MNPFQKRAMWISTERLKLLSAMLRNYETVSRIFQQSADGVLSELLSGATMESGDGGVRATVRHGRDVLLIGGRVAYTRPRPKRAAGERRAPVQIDKRRSA